MIYLILLKLEAMLPASVLAVMMLMVEMFNPYNVIDASKNERVLICNISGQPLRRGIYVDGIYDIGRIENHSRNSIVRDNLGTQ